LIAGEDCVLAKTVPSESSMSKEDLGDSTMRSSGSMCKVDDEALLLCRNALGFGDGDFSDILRVETLAVGSDDMIVKALVLGSCAPDWALLFAVRESGLSLRDVANRTTSQALGLKDVRVDECSSLTSGLKLDADGGLAEESVSSNVDLGVTLLPLEDFALRVSGDSSMIALIREELWVLLGGPSTVALTSMRTQFCRL